MLRLNLFTVIEKMTNITKSSISEAVSKLADKVGVSVAVYVKLRIASEIMAAVSDQVKASLLNDPNFDKGSFQGVTVSRRSGSTTKIFDDTELDELAAESKVIAAKIKARKTFLTETENYASKTGSDTVTMKISE